MWSGLVWCVVLWYGVVWSGMVWFGVVCRLIAKGAWWRQSLLENVDGKSSFLSVNPVIFCEVL